MDEEQKQYEAFLAEQVVEEGGAEDFLRQHHASSQIRAALIENIDYFIRYVVHPLRFFQIYPDSYLKREAMGIYEYQGQWVTLPGKYRFNGFVYIDKVIIPEVLKYLSRKESGADLFHATGSAALEGIGRQEAILSAREALQQGEKVKTGEYVTYIGHQGRSVSGGREGLGTVLASTKVSTAYARARWFDEFHLVFGISSEEQAGYLKKKGYSEVRFRRSWQGGIALGPRVPLTAVGEIYCPYLKISELKAWTGQFCPEATIIPLEAPLVLALLKITRYRDVCNSARFWQKLSLKESVDL